MGIKLVCLSLCIYLHVLYEQEAQVALYYMERPLMEAAFAKADDIGLAGAEGAHPVIGEVHDALALDPQKFTQLQLKIANRLGDHARAIRIMIQLKGQILPRRTS